jgi:uncharacterized repeat protein (TIGR01451 family)
MTCKLLLLAILAVLALSLFSSAAWAQVNPGDIFVLDVQCCGGTGGIFKIDPTKTANPAGNNQTLISSGHGMNANNVLGVPVAITVDLDRQHLLVADQQLLKQSGQPAAVVRIDPTLPDGANQTVISSGGLLTKPSDGGIAIDGSGNIYVANQSNPPTIVKIDAVSHTQSIFTSGANLTTPWGIEFETLPNLIVADSAGSPPGTNGRIVQVTPAGVQTVVSSNGFLNCPFGATVQNPGNGTIYASVFPTIFNVGCAPSALIVGVEPTLGGQSQVSPNPTFGPQCENGGTTFAVTCLTVPTGLAVHPSLPSNPNRSTPITNAIIVADLGTQNQPGVPGGTDRLILGIEPTTGIQHIIAINNTTNTNFLTFPIDVTIVPGASSTPLTPNLSVTKTADVSTVTAGDPNTHTYTITITNTGAVTAQGVTLTDTWPTGFNRTAVNGCTLTNGSATGTGNFTCTVGNVPGNGGSATVTATFTVPSSTPAGTQTNSVQVTSSTPGSNTATANNNIAVTTNAPLTVTKDDHVQFVTAGDGATYTYTIIVSNNGPSDAQNVVLTDTWPSGFNRTATTTGCTPMTGNGSFTCPLGTLTAHSSVNIFAQYTVPSSTPPGDQTNTVSVTSSTPPNTPGNPATASDTTTVNGPPPSLSITKAGPSTVNTGAPFNYTLRVMNSGQGPATTVQVTDQLPSGVGFVSASGTGWACTQSSGTVTCTMPSIAANTTAPDITINVTAPSSPTTINNTAKVQASNNGSTSSNTVQTIVTQTPPPPSPNLSITKAGPSTVNTGAAFTYTLTVTNSGNAAATSVQVTDQLPAGVGFVSATGTGWNCTQSSPVTCTMSTIAANTTPPNITINVTAPSTPGTISNQATVQASNNPPTSSNTVMTTVTQPAQAPAKWTGSGKIKAQNGGFAEFGFNVRTRRDGSIQGHLEFENEKSKLDAQSITINSMTVVGQTLTFTGTVRERGHGGQWSGSYNFTVTATDNDNPPGPDTFSIQISDPSHTNESGTVVKGKIEQGTFDGRDDKDDVN